MLGEDCFCDGALLGFVEFFNGPCQLFKFEFRIIGIACADTSKHRGGKHHATRCEYERFMVRPYSDCDYNEYRENYPSDKLPY